MSQCSSQYNEIKDVDGLNLFGMLPINKRLTLQVPKFLSLFLYEILNSKFFSGMPVSCNDGDYYFSI